jgi:hypothetical protein
MLDFYKKNKKISNLFLVIMLVVVSFGVAHFALAGPIDTAVTTIVGWIASLIIKVCGWILTIAISSIITIISYNNFVNEASIVQAWVIVRDLCNMFFILILLVVAFATILRIESYQWKKILPKLLIMAVLINFSKTICGLLIDFSQVIMLTFSNAFSGGGGNFINALGVQKFLDIAQSKSTFWGIGDETLNLTNTVAAMMFVIILLIIATVTMIAIMVVFLMRMIMLWIYVVLSPFAFLLMAFPAGQKYASQWWSEFVKYLINGPVLAFFIWLSLMVMSNAPKFENSIFFDPKTGSLEGGGSQLIQALTTSTFVSFILAIGMLVGGLMISQQIGGLGASAGMSMLNNLKSKGLGVGRAGLGLAMKGAALPFIGAKTFGGFMVDKLQQKQGVDLNLSRAWKTLQEKRAEKSKERYAEGQVAAGKAMTQGGRMHGILAMTGSPGDAYDTVTHTDGIVPRGIMQRLSGGRNLKKQADAIEPELVQAEFESKFMAAGLPDRKNEIDKLESRKKDIDAEIAGEESKGFEKDNSKIADLNKQKETIDKKLDFVGQGMNQVKTFTPEAQKSAQEKTDALRQDYNKFKPRTPFEARAAEQSVVASKMSKIKDISAPTELLRILQDAIQQHDKTMIKAVTLKMTKDYNDNEFLQPLAGDTSHVGLKKLMNGLSTKGDKNYAGFDKQEAYGLGSQIAELNKATNHWGATSAYLMENGRWRETTDAEHAEIRTTETGKLHPQQLVRVVNRLGFGKHMAGGKYEIDVGGLITLKQLDNPGGIKQLKDNMTESTVQYLHNSMPQLKKTGYLSDELLGAIEERAKSSSIDFDKKYNEAREGLERANKSS